ncbi:allophanate hydrolase [Pseudonocardia sp. CA-107938]|uniref:allophanate hydrolase n=1 Tax=Pseudonocardia sp. CA-107938 TaxID=3240021 RepID=UPI003D913E72
MLIPLAVRDTVPTTVRGLRAALASGALDVHAVVEAVLDRIAARGSDATWISRTTPEALHARAAELAAARAAGADLPLYGVPFAVKDNIDVAGLPTTCACPDFAYEPVTDATAVRRLLDAGAIVVGKTNLDQFATGLVGTRSPYGACESVFGGDLVSGGSSSGSAVAVAAGIVPFALGTDTAGSGRVPAALNGIVGLKPTRGLVPTTGVVPACRSLDCVSVFTTDVPDAADVLAVLAGPDPDDPWSRTGTPTTPGTRTAVPAPRELDVDDGTAAVFASVAARCEITAEIPLGPLVEAGDLLYGGPWVAERLADLEAFLEARPESVLPVTRMLIERGRDFDAVAAFRGRHRLQELRAWCARIWEHADVLLLPTVPTTFTRAEIAEEPVARNLVLGRYTQFANLLDLAAIAVPVGTTAAGRPVGVTLFGPAFAEDRLITAAHELAVREAA